MTSVTVVIAPDTGAVAGALARHAPRFAARLRYAVRTATAGLPWHQRIWELCVAAELRSADPPVAALARRGDGVIADAAAWLCADPVYLQADLHSLRLTDPRTLAVTAEEADRLIDQLNGNLVSTGLRLLRGIDAARWYASCDRHYAAVTTPLALAVGGDLRQQLPGGQDAVILRRYMNDAQMVLHETTDNRARERAGLAPINGVWLWGGGLLPPDIAAPPFEVIIADDPFALGLARHTGLAALPLPAAATALDAAWAGAGRVLVVLADTAGHAGVLETLARALQRGSITVIELETGTMNYVIRRHDNLKIWRRFIFPGNPNHD